MYPLIKKGAFLTDEIPERYKLHYEEANADSFMPSSLLAEIDKETKAVS
jgi:hypothetical protein